MSFAVSFPRPAGRSAEGRSDAQRRPLGFVAVLATVLAVLLASASPAAAFVPSVSGEVICAADGRQVITWTVQNTPKASERNLSLVIKSITVTRGSVIGFAEGDVLPPLGQPGSTVTGTTTLPGDATGDVTLRVVASWVDENGEPAGAQNSPSSATVELPGDCRKPPEPAVPAASIVASCVEGGALVTLSNTGGTATTFTVTKAGSAVESVEVGPGGSATRTYPMAEDETAVFRATAPGGFDTGPVSVTFDCLRPPAPQATIVASCVEGGALVTLSNTGGTATTFTVSKGDSAIDSVEVGPGGSASRTYAMIEDEAAIFRATAPGGFDTGPVSVTFNCAEPVAPTSRPTEVQGVLIQRAPAVVEQPVTAQPAGAAVQPATVARAAAAEVAAQPAVAAASLVRTGANTETLALFGSLITVIGGLLLLASWSSASWARPARLVHCGDGVSAYWRPAPLRLHRHQRPQDGSTAGWARRHRPGLRQPGHRLARRRRGQAHRGGA